MVLPKLLRLDEFWEGSVMKSAILHRVYLHGYQQCILPRWLRRTLARTGFHRAWLSGFHGRFEEAGVMYGPANPYPPAEQEVGEQAEWSEQLVRHGLPPG